MGEWTLTTLGEVVQLQRGHDLPTQDRRPGRVPIVGSFGITGWHDTAKVKGPGVTIGRSGASFGTAAYVERDYWPLNTCLYVTDFRGNDPRWAYSLLHQIDFSGYNSGSAQPSLNRNFLAKIPVCKPPLDEQRRIAGVLGALDDLIETNRHLARALEDQMLTLFAAEGFDAEPGGDSVALSELVEVNPKLAKPAGDAPYVDMAALPTDSSRIATVVRRPATGGARFQNGDTLLARLTPCLENGKAAFVDLLGPGEVAVGSTEFLVLRARGTVGPHWPYALVRSERFRDYAIRHMNGSSGRQRCSADSVEAYRLVPPMPDVVERFRTSAASAFEAIGALNNEVADLTRVRCELLPLLMSGRVRVREEA